MSETQMDRFEGLLTQLVSMVGHIKQDVEHLKQDVGDLKQDVSGLKIEMASMQMKQDELLSKFDSLKVDQDIAWAKIAENERDIERIKQHINV